MMVARSIAGGTVDHLACDNLNRVISQYVVDTDRRVLVWIDEIRWDRIAAPGRWNGVLQTKFAQ